MILFLAGAMAGIVPEGEGTVGGTASAGDRSPQILIVDDSGGQAFLTIQAAIDAASTDDFVRVYDGVYNENVTIDKGVHLIGNGSATTTITNDGSRDVITVSENGWSIKGFSIINQGARWAGIALDRVMHGNVWDCRIACIGGGAFGIRGDELCINNTIMNCTISDANDVGVQLAGSNTIISNSFVVNRVAVSVHGNNNWILGNTFDDDITGVNLGYLPRDVLLMGNSYTYANSLDDLLERQLDTLTTEIAASRLAAGGLTLSNHASSASTPGHQWNVTLNDGRPWDAVVLQDQSQIPGFPTSQSSWQSSLRGARTLDGMIQDLGADTVFLMTWGRRDGDSTNPSLYPNFTVMQAHLEVGYRMYAENLSTEDRPAYIAPAGLAFKWVHDYVASQGTDPTTQGSMFYNLYSSDGSHPSITGSYLTSCVLYATLTGNSPVGLKDGTPISSDLKNLLQRAAADTVFNNTLAYDYPWRPSWENVVKDNVFEVWGVAMTLGCNATGNTISNNSFSITFGSGIYVLDAKSTGNTIHHNGFRDSGQGMNLAKDPTGSNAWDDGAEGNFWSDYPTKYPAATNDGITWDTPYDIFGGEFDRYPLVRFPAFEDHDPPEAFAGPDQEVDEGTLVQLDGRGSRDEVGIVNHTWSFEYDGETVQLHGSQVVFQFDVPGVYNVTLNVTDAAGNWGVDHVVITVVDTTKPIARIGPLGGPFDQHERVTLDGSGSHDQVGIVNWTWMFTYDGEIVYLHGDVTGFVFDAVGEYLVELTVFDGAGNIGVDIKYFTVLDTDPPLADAGPDVAVDQEFFVTLDATTSSDNVGIISYTWTFEEDGTTIILNGRMLKHQFLYPGVYPVILTVNDDAGNTAVDVKNVTVRDTQPPVVVVEYRFYVIQFDKVTISALNSTDNVGIVRYLWAFEYDDSPVEIEGGVFEFTFDIWGSYHINLTVYDAEGLSSSDFTSVYVQFLDEIPPVAKAGPDRSILQGMMASFDGGRSTDNSYIYSWNWTFNYDGEDREITGETVAYRFDIAGEYVITLTVRDSWDLTDEDTLILTVKDITSPVPPQMEDLDVDAGDQVRMNASGGKDNVGIVRWTWTFVYDGQEVVLEGEEVEFTFDEPGEYEVALTIEDAEGNAGQRFFTVTVEDTSWTWMVLFVILAFLVGLLVYFMRPVKGDEERQGR